MQRVVAAIAILLSFAIHALAHEPPAGWAYDRNAVQTAIARRLLRVPLKKSPAAIC